MSYFTRTSVTILQVVFLNMADLSVTKQFTMPTPMHFKEEGGASLSPDGAKFIAVSCA